MLLHQFILVMVGAVKRFESVLLAIPGAVRRLVSRRKLGGSDLRET
ncbi:MAG: hypothetical protein ABSD98_10715 [Candidatus Korobacteraceae bacterium]|jgi:hypothetical protein